MLSDVAKASDPAGSPSEEPGKYWRLTVFTVLAEISELWVLSQPRTPAFHRADELSGKRQTSAPEMLTSWSQCYRAWCFVGSTLWCPQHPRIWILPTDNVLRRSTAPIPLGNFEEKNSLPRVGMFNLFPLRFSCYDKGFYRILSQVLEVNFILPKLRAHWRVT